MAKSDCKKDQFNKKMTVGFIKPDEMVLDLGGFNEHASRWITGFEHVHGNAIGKNNVEKKDVLEFCTEKEW